jgi:hypothetical protein
MARPQKRTVDYFSHDADASSGKTLTIIENNFGLEGYAAWFKLLELIAKADNHVLNCRNEEDMEFLSAKLRLQSSKAKSILQKMADLGAIDAELFSEGIIWSQNFVDRLKDVYDNRKQELPTKPDNTVNNTDNKVMNSSLTTITELSTPEIQQSKVKKTKVNNSKENTIPKNIYGEFKNVLLADDELTKLKTRFPSGDAEKKIENLSQYIASHGKKYQSHYATILNWARDEQTVQPKKEVTSGKLTEW